MAAGERRRRKVRHRPRDRVADVLLDPFGEIVVVQPHHDPGLLGERARVQGGLQVHDVAVGHRDQGPAGGDAGRQQRLLTVGLAGDDLQAEAASHRHPGGVLVLVHADDVDAQVVQLADDAGADVAEPGDDHVVS